MTLGLVLEEASKNVSSLPSSSMVPQASITSSVVSSIVGEDGKDDVKGVTEAVWS